MKRAKNPNLSLRVLYVSSAGRKVVRVVPDDEKITIGSETWKCTRAHILSGKGKFDCIAVQGRSECAPIWEKAPVSSEEYDSTANNNILEQIHSLSRGNKTSAVNWIQMGMTALLFIAIIGVGVKLNSDMDALGKKLDQGFHPALTNCAGGACQDTSTVYTTPQPQPKGPQQLTGTSQT